LVPVALLFLAVPAFAVCGYCDEFNTCRWSPGLYQRCYYEHYICHSVCVEEGNPNCGPRFAAMETFSSEYRIVAVKVEAARVSPIKQETPVTLPKKSKKT
jgi:hypothetical protein